jgi:hypothetical protein
MASGVVQPMQNRGRRRSIVRRLPLKLKRNSRGLEAGSLPADFNELGVGSGPRGTAAAWRRVVFNILLYFRIYGVAKVWAFRLQEPANPVAQEISTRAAIAIHWMTSRNVATGLIYLNIPAAPSLNLPGAA